MGSENRESVGVGIERKMRSYLAAKYYSGICLGASDTSMHVSGNSAIHADLLDLEVVVWVW
jgi:hypothetical protein